MVGSPVIPAGVDGGAVLLGELNCVACHATDTALARRLQSKQAPRLDQVGARVLPHYLRAFLLHPHEVKPGTPMPDLLHGLGGQEKAETVDVLVHFLVSCAGDARPQPGGADEIVLEVGRKLYHQIGCVACHDPQEPPSGFRPFVGTQEDDSGDDDPDADAQESDDPDDPDDVDPVGERRGVPMITHRSIPLGHLAAKTTLDPLAKFLLDPLAVRPSGRMPSLNLSTTEAVAIAAYLLRDQFPDPTRALPTRVSGLKYHYYEIYSPRELPDFDALEPAATGFVEQFTIGVPRREYQFALKFSGLVTVPADGTYSFFTKSNDGSRLTINGQLVVDNDGLHGGQEEESGQIMLKAGVHPIRVTYFQQDGGEELLVSYSGPGIDKQPIPASVLSHWAVLMQPVGGQEPLSVDPVKATRGRALFASLGCAACHRIGTETESIASDIVARPLLQLDPDSQVGCISRQVAPGRPKFQLSTDQRVALRRTLASVAERFSPPGANRTIAHRMTVLNCYACHTRDGTGGPEAGRAVYFSVVGHADLGEEGRMPPPLTDVGNKLKTAWLGNVLTDAGAVRPYMATRMPQFGADNVGDLSKLLEQTDAVDLDETLPVDRQLLRPFGRKLVGSKGMSCVACHAFAEYKPSGPVALNLIDTTRRIRKAWFRRYLLNPASLRPGTRMPSAWPGGKSIRSNILEGDTDRQIESIWCFLSEGEQAKTPEGLVQGKMELGSVLEAVVYRGFIQGAGVRGIGVGYPQRANLAFDADQLRLALIWAGPFLDVAEHRTGRSSEFVPPLGERVMVLAQGAPLALLENLDQRWPTATGKAAGFRMRGYRLDDLRRPTFLFSFRDIGVEDFPVAVETELNAKFVRTLSFRAEQTVENLWFRAAVGQTIEESHDGSYRIDRKWTVRFPLSTIDVPVVRGQNGKRELLVPVRFRDRRATLVEEIVW
ncbi:MAG: PA14 domain-containing protein [Pirellulales bacterium]